MINGKVMIMEDDADIREGVHILLESEGYEVTEAGDGRSGLDLLDDTYDLVILDIMMPGMSGLQTCKELRKTSNVPVLFLTAKSQESDKMIGLFAGGDDYLTKPFTYPELLGRVKALIRRYRVYRGKEEKEEPSFDSFVRRGTIRVNKDLNEIYDGEKRIELSDIEYRILLLLISHPGQVFSAQSIYENVWNEPYFYSCNSTVTVHIRKLRVKLEKDPQNPERIKTVWGKGYMFSV